ncbi:MAG TPA: hypothetical protein VFR67_06710 [Pilimelia sp.]|nr:hypothetical protein [Pilimelia sp.]
MPLTASRALIRQTERWFVGRGVPNLIARYSFTRHVLPRMLPFLAFVVVASLTWLVPVDNSPAGWALRGAVLGAGLVVWAALLVVGRGLPHFSRRGTWAVLVTYALLPFVVPLLMLALHDRDAAEDALGVEAARTPWAFYSAAVLTLLTAYGLLAVVAWLVTANGLVPLTRRAFGQAWGDMRSSVRLQGRALPLLLFATMFFFFTGELWQAMNRLSWWRLALVLALFAAVTVLAAAARLRDEIGRVEQDLSPPRLEQACDGTPLDSVPIAEVTGGDRPLTPVPLSNREAGNLLLMLATRQLVQAVVVGLGLFVFFLALGVAMVDDATAAQWIGEPPRYSAVLPGLPVALLRNAALLAGFGSMYFAVTSMSDTEHRQQFFAPILDEVERTLAVRAVYLAVRDVVQPPAANPTKPR